MQDKNQLTAAVITLGCKVNQYESQAIAAALVDLGFSASITMTAADLYVINTCSVTAEADKKSRQTIARVLKINPAASIIVMGCSSQNDASQYMDKPQVIAVFGTGGKIENIKKAAQEFIVIRQAKDTEKYELKQEFKLDLQLDLQPTITSAKKVKSSTFSAKSGKSEQLFSTPKTYEDDMLPVVTKTRAYLKIQDGCNSFCAYCRVPYLRGASRSRPIFSIISEAQRLAESVKEIVLTGVDISAFGRDCGSSLAELIEQIAAQNLPVRWRLSSLECGVITERLLAAMQAANFCDHFHLSLQSGSDTVLARMNRRYTTAQFLDKAKLIRQYYPLAGITTDVIAGFSYESAEEHIQTRDFLRQVGFSDVHVFPFSPRRGTKAYGFEQLDTPIRTARAHELAAVAAELKKEFLQQNLGRVMQVCAENSERGYVSGFTTNYIKVYTGLRAGELKLQRLARLFKDGVIGE